MNKKEEIMRHVATTMELTRELGECKKQPNCANCKMSKTCLRLCQLYSQLRYDLDTNVDKS